VTLTGSGFGADPGYVEITQGTVDYGAPTDAYKVRIISWSSSEIAFEVPNGYSGPGLTPGQSATLRVASAANVLSDPITVNVSSPAQISVSGITPNPISAGEWVTVAGDGFGSTQGSGYVWISQNGVNWGAPGDSYPVAIKSWTNTAVTFLAPTSAYEVDGHWEAAIQGGSLATIQIVNGAGLETSPQSIQVDATSSAAPSLTSVTSLSTNTLTLAGANFPAEPSLTTAPGGGFDQPVLEITDTATNANYGYSGSGTDWYGLNYLTWNSGQITIAFGPSPPASGQPLVIKLYEQVNGSWQVVAETSTTVPS
jgi:hypothetical protein